ICALILLLVRREHSALASLPRRWAWQLFAAYSTGQPARLVAPSDDPTRRRFPYGLAIACGTAFSLLWSTPSAACPVRRARTAIACCRAQPVLRHRANPFR